MIPHLREVEYPERDAGHPVAQWWSRMRGLLDLAHHIHRGPRVSMQLRRTKWRVRALLYGRDLAEVHRFMQSTGVLRDIVQAYPRLYEKVYRPYLVCGLSPRQRARLICGHYQLACDYLSDAQLRAIHQHQGLNLCTVAAGAQPYTTRLRYVDQFEKEGEWTLELLCPLGKRVYCASFSLIGQNSHDLGVVIGCLQGPSLQTEEGREQIKHLTKTLHGLRPKALMIILVQLLGSKLGVKRLYGVRNAGHAYHCILNKRARVQMDYDAFWTELGGDLVQGRLAELPLHPHRRAPDEIKSHKRSQYARRYALIDDLQVQIREQMGALSNSVDYR
ncbi:VirK/YbjX family protein [Thiomonas arsenitoxydans]|nr:VirK/YbjX family protein [Thiomonas arsenitoxydans]